MSSFKNKNLNSKRWFRLNRTDNLKITKLVCFLDLFLLLKRQLFWIFHLKQLPYAQVSKANWKRNKRCVSVNDCYVPLQYVLCLWKLPKKTNGSLNSSLFFHLMPLSLSRYISFKRFVINVLVSIVLSSKIEEQSVQLNGTSNFLMHKFQTI